MAIPNSRSDRSTVISSARSHPEGYAVNIYRDASLEIKLATAYGATTEEARCRADRIAWALSPETATTYDGEVYEVETV